MRYLIATCLALLMLSPPALRAAEDVKHGLLWHKSGLPAVFPLQIKTIPGRDYHLTLISPKTQDGVLAAYVTGGQFFRVLVPPGTYELQIAFGTKWQDADTLFGTGPQTGQITVDTPLTFETRGIGTKAGHLIDLRRAHADDDRQASVQDIALCQRARRELQTDRNSRFGLDLATRLYEPNGPALPPAARTLKDEAKKDPALEPRLDLEITVQSRVCG